MAEDLTRRVIRSTTKVALTGVTAGFTAWAATASVRSMLKKRADEALALASATPLAAVLPTTQNDPEPTPAPTDAAPAKAKAEAEAPAPTAPPKAPEPAEPLEPVVLSAAAIEVGAPGVATESVEELTEQLVAEHSIPATPSAADLPIEGFDSITVGSLRARLRQFGMEDLAVLREWELAHAHRPQVVTMLENRIAKLRAEATGQA